MNYILSFIYNKKTINIKSYEIKIEKRIRTNLSFVPETKVELRCVPKRVYHNYDLNYKYILEFRETESGKFKTETYNANILYVTDDNNVVYYCDEYKTPLTDDIINKKCTLIYIFNILVYMNIE